MKTPDHELKCLRAEAGELRDWLKRNRKELEQKGFDVDENLAALDEEVSAASEATTRAEDAREQYLRACADLAEAQIDAYRLFCLWMAGIEQTQPFHPLLAEWRELRLEWEKLLPRAEQQANLKGQKNPSVRPNTRKQKWAKPSACAAFSS